MRLTVGASFIFPLNSRESATMDKVVAFCLAHPDVDTHPKLARGDPLPSSEEREKYLNDLLARSPSLFLGAHTCPCFTFSILV